MMTSNTESKIQALKRIREELPADLAREVRIELLLPERLTG